MKARRCGCFALAALTALFAEGAVVQFDLSGVVNKDIIYETGGGADAFGGNPFGTQAFVEDGYTDGMLTADGLPVDGLLASNESGLGQYQLQPYNGLNVVELGVHNSELPVSYLIAVPNSWYKQLGLLVSGVEGDVSFTIQLHYSDGTEIGWWEADDWFETGGNLRASQNVIISGMDRVNVNTGTVEDSNHFSLFEFVVATDTNRMLTGITIGNTPNRWPDDQQRWGAVFAINGEAVDVVPEPSSLLLVGLGALLLRRIRRFHAAVDAIK